MFSQFSTADLDVAPPRARLRWAEAIDEALDATVPPTAAPALRRVRDVLRDGDQPVSRDDLQRLRTFLRATAAAPRDADAETREALDLAGAFEDGAARHGRRCLSA